MTAGSAGLLIAVRNGNHNHNAQHELAHIQHSHPGLIRSPLHIHVNHDSCLEVLILDGKVKEIKHLADQIVSSNGVRSGELVLS